MGLTTHGYSSKSYVDGKEIRNRTYVAWKNMWARCTDSNKPQWKDYGGRGIVVCERWKEFINFLADMGEVPEERSLERKDNDSGYYPDNCVWGTRLEQSKNRRGRAWNSREAGVGFIGHFESQEAAINAKFKFLEENFGED